MTQRPTRIYMICVYLNGCATNRPRVPIPALHTASKHHCLITPYEVYESCHRWGQTALCCLCIPSIPSATKYATAHACYERTHMLPRSHVSYVTISICGIYDFCMHAYSVI